MKYCIIILTVYMTESEWMMFLWVGIYETSVKKGSWERRDILEMTA